MTEKSDTLPMDKRRNLLRLWRKQSGITLIELGKRANVSQPMLTQFETGVRTLSEEAWRRVLDSIEQLLTERREKLASEIAKARGTMGRLTLGEQLTKQAQTIHSLSLREEFVKYKERDAGLSGPPLSLADLPDILELWGRSLNEAGNARSQLNFFTKWHAENPADQRAERAEAMVENLEKFIEEHLSTIASGEAAKLADKEKQFAAMREEYHADLRRLSFKDEEIR